MSNTVQNSEKIGGKNQKSGWVILDKPIGMSSHTATNLVRKICRADKAGHCGTLDPLASGVLPIALGAATKLVDFVVATEKSYDFSIIWGEERTTDDRAGEITALSPIRPDQAAILDAIPQFIGMIEQIPPDFSAIKIQGKPAYHRARKGESNLHKPRSVTIHALSLTHHSTSESCFTLQCGKGVYVRSIARDLARKLGSFGHVGMLRRTKVGKCLIENAISLEKLTAIGHSGDDLSVLQPIPSLLDDILVMDVTAAEANFLAFGRAVELSPDRLCQKDNFAPLSQDDANKLCESQALPVLAFYQGQPAALGRWDGDKFTPRRVFITHSALASNSFAQNFFAEWRDRGCLTPSPNKGNCDVDYS